MDVGKAYEAGCEAHCCVGTLVADVGTVGAVCRGCLSVSESVDG